MKQLNGPFLLAVDDGYEASKPKVVVVGQENNGWLECDYLAFLEASNIDQCLAVYRKFDIAEYGHGTFGRYFASLRQALHGQVTDSNRRSVMWTNLFKLNHKGQQTIYSPHLEAILAIQGNIVAQEIDILRPDVVIFLTGPRYDGIIRHAFPDAEFRAVNGHPVNELSHISAGHLPALSFRTYHPAFLNRVRRTKRYCLQAIIDRVLDSFPLGDGRSSDPPTKPC
ncbi:MAG: hypothetical protein ACR2FY_07550 [Pirellulaceae bacterium]